MALRSLSSGSSSSGASGSPLEAPPATGGLAGRLRGLDAFGKVEAEYQTRSGLGGAASVVVGVVLLVLVAHELAAAGLLRALGGAVGRPRLLYEYLIDNTASQPLTVNLDVVVGLECQYLTLLMFDVTGSVSTDFSSKLRFHPTAIDLSDLGPTGLASTGVPADAAVDVRRKIMDAARNLGTLRIKAVGPGAAASSSQAQPQFLSGCKLHGSFPIRKVGGRLQIMAQGHGQGNVHTPHEVLNFTHRINHLSFGEPFPGIVNPLDGQVEVSTDPFQMFQYFVSIVPTVYIDASDNKLYTNQYAVTEYNRVVDHNKGSHGVPGILIKFDIEPLLMRVIERAWSLPHLLVRLSGIIGGVWVSFGLVKVALEWTAERLGLSV